MEAHAGRGDPATGDPASAIAQAAAAYDPTAYNPDAQGAQALAGNNVGHDPYGQSLPGGVGGVGGADLSQQNDNAATGGGGALDAKGGGVQPQQQTHGGHQEQPYHQSSHTQHQQQQQQQQHPYTSQQHQDVTPQPLPAGQLHQAGGAAGDSVGSLQPQSAEGYTPQQVAQQGSGAGPPPTAYKVFCGGLSFQTDEDKLREYFERLGTVVDVVIMRDRMSGHPRGFGFVSFAEEAVAKDVASRRHDIDGRQVEAKIAIPRNQVAPGGSMRNGGGGGGLGGGLRHGVGNVDGGHSGGLGGAPHGSGGGPRPNTSHLNKIFVGGLPSQVGESDFSQYFQQYGEVVDAQVMIDHQTGNSRGFGFISFADQASVELVVGPGRSSTRHEIMGKTVEVKRAEPKGSTGGDRRSRDSYGASGQRNQYGSGGGLTGGGMQGGGAAQPGAGAATGVAGGAGGAFAGYNYPASVMEQYGQYYNNPQWQQYYASMGYNMQAYPQGYNPYTYYAAYMNNAAAGAAATGENDGGAGAGNAGGDGGGGGGGPGGLGGDGGQMRGGGGGGGYGGAPNGNRGVGMGGGGPGNGPGGPGGGRRSSRGREDRYHPYH